MFIHFLYGDCVGEFDNADLAQIVNAIEALASGRVYHTLKEAFVAEQELVSKIRFESSMQGLAAIHHATWLPDKCTSGSSTRGKYVIDIVAPSIASVIGAISGIPSTAPKEARFTAVWKHHYDADGKIKPGIVPHTFCIINYSSDTSLLNWGE